jgi:hypothetical protein
VIVRTVMIEVQVPEECTAVAVLVLASGALTEHGIRNQVRQVGRSKTEEGELPEPNKEDPLD